MLKKYDRVIVWTLAVAMIFSASMLCAQPPAAARDSATVKPKPDLDYITPDAFAAAIIYPQSVLKSPRLEFLPVEVLSAGIKNEAGIDPVEIEQAIFVARAGQGRDVRGYAKTGRAAAAFWLAAGVGFHFEDGQAYRRRGAARAARHTTEGTLDGKTYRKGKRPEDLSLYQADERTLIFGTDDFLRKIVANHAVPAPAGSRQCSVAAGRRTCWAWCSSSRCGHYWPR